MGQPGLLSRSQLAAMRDRTTLRNYSPEADRFRRDHKRHRDWGLTQRHARRLRQIRGRLDGSRTPSTAGNPRPDRARPPSGPLGDGPPQPEQVDLTAPTPRPTRREQPRNTGPDQAGASSPSPARVHGTRVQATEPGQPDPAGQCQIGPRNTRQPRPVGQHHPRLPRYATPRLSRYATPNLSAGDTPRRPARIGPCRRQALLPTHREGNTVTRALPTNPSRGIQPASIHRQRSPFFDARNNITSGHHLESTRNGPPPHGQNAVPASNRPVPGRMRTRTDVSTNGPSMPDSVLSSA
jgi:hypothetical protein